MNLLQMRSLRIVVGSVALAIFIFSYWHWLSYKDFLSQPINWPDKKQVLVIEKGKGINQLARQWQQQNIVESSLYLRVFCWFNPEYTQIKVGEYQITDTETPVSLLQKLVSGKVIQYAVTIVEGTNSFQLLEQLKQNPHLKVDLDFESEALLQAIAIDSSHIEGWFYPDTYHVAKGSSVKELLSRAYKKMHAILQQEWQNRAPDLPYQTPYEALIMASIIEKETGIASERNKIAGVFVRRLNKKMRLQTDPTVIYGIGPSFNGDITYKDLRTPTPYNTYVIKGLPPTPIAMPGQEAIHAALHPADGKELYFVATGDGGHYFSETLEEHNKAVQRYLNRQ